MPSARSGKGSPVPPSVVEDADHKQCKVLEGYALKRHFPVGRGGLRANQGERVVHAVDGIDIAVDSGETLGLVGESGCGKSTTARLVMLLESLTDGVIRFRGKDVRSFTPRDFREYRRHVQVVFQDPYSSFNPRLTIGASIAEPLTAAEPGLGKTEISERVRGVLLDAGLSASANAAYPHQLSGGQRQRAAIARALVTRPSIIVLDEPVSALDVSIRAQVMNLLRDLQEMRGVGYLLIAHDLAMVKYVSTRVAVMYLGRIVETGSRDSVYQRPKHPYTRALLTNVLPVHPRTPFQPEILRGEVPSPIDPPSGCRFRTRCPVVMEICSAIEPQLTPRESGHYVACHLEDEDRQ